MLRHGDVVLVKIPEIPSEAKLIKDRKELAYGKVTGHAHRLDVGELFETKDGKLYCKVGKAKLSHEEHKTLTLKPGDYEVIIKRQYTPEGWERVAD